MTPSLSTTAPCHEAPSTLLMASAAPGKKQRSAFAGGERVAWIKRRLRLEDFLHDTLAIDDEGGSERDGLLPLTNPQGEPEP